MLCPVILKLYISSILYISCAFLSYHLGRHLFLYSCTNFCCLFVPQSIKLLTLPGMGTTPFIVVRTLILRTILFIKCEMRNAV